MPSRPGSDDTTSTRRRLALAVTVALILGVAGAVGVATWGYSYDDAFISYRYARNLAAGAGLVFNPGERVLGTTAPGFAFLLGALSRLTGLDVASVGTLSGLLGLLAVALCPLLLPADRRPPPLWIAVFGVALLSLRWHVELLGGESLPVLGLATLAMVLALARDRPLPGGLLMAAAASLRLDTAIAAGVLGLALWVTRRRLPWGYAAGLLPAGASVLATWAYFGAVVPQSFHGKQGEFAELQTGSYTASQGAWLVRELGAAGAVALLLAAAAGAWLLLRQRRGHGPLLAALCAWVLAMELFYRLARVPFAPWYHVTTVSALLALAAWACLAAARRLARPVARPFGRGALASGLCCLLMLPVVAPSFSFLAASWRRPPDPRWEVYRRVGRLLAERTEPGRVALVEIGVVSYFAPEHPVLDLIGLVSPEAAALGAETALAAGDARYVVDASLFHRRFPFLAELGPPRWRLLAELTDPASGRGLIRVLEREPAPDAPPP